MKKRPLIAWIRDLARDTFVFIRKFYLTKIYKMDIHPTARIAFGSRLDKTHPQGIHIGKNTSVTTGVVVFSHDACRCIWATDTFIGDYCFIGVNAIIMPGVNIGNEVIVGAGSIVTKDIPSNSLAVGNPAKVIKTDIKRSKWPDPKEGCL